MADMPKAATDALASNKKPKKVGATAVHMHIRPTEDQKSFIIEHQPHAEGMPMGKKTEHIASDKKELLKHIEKIYGGEDASKETEAGEMPAAAPAAQAIPVKE